MRNKLVLCILDGCGVREETDGNAFKNANTPTLDMLFEKYPNSILEASGPAVGLPKGQMGTSEVGHMNLGAGRVVMQDLPRIDHAIENNTLEQNQVLTDLINSLKQTGGTCHLMGLMSPGGVHSHQNHIVALAKILNDNNIKVDVHAFLDGRDTPPSSAEGFLAEFENEIKDMSLVKVATVSGRFYAMDRDKRWDRVELAYNNIMSATGEKFATSADAIKASYENNVTDEFVFSSHQVAKVLELQHQSFQ